MRAAWALVAIVVLLAPTAAAQFPSGPTSSTFTEPLLLGAGEPDRPLPATGEPVAVPLTVKVACAGLQRGPVGYAIVSGPSWITVDFRNLTHSVPSDPRACGGDGYYTFENAVVIRARTGVPGGLQDNLTLVATRDSERSNAAVIPLRVEAAARLLVTNEAPPFLVPEDTREARGVLLLKNGGNVPADVSIAASAPPSVLVDAPTAPRRLDPGSEWRVPITVRVSEDREETFTVRFAITAVPLDGATPSEETIGWSLAPPSNGSPRDPPAPTTVGSKPSVQAPRENTESASEEATTGERNESPVPALGALAAAGLASIIVRRRRA